MARKARSSAPFEELLEEALSDPDVRREYEALEAADEVTRLRIRRGLTQEQLAELAGTHQPEIARLESGKKLPNLAFLKRVVEAMGGCVEIHVYAREEASAPLGSPHEGSGADILAES